MNGAAAHVDRLDLVGRGGADRLIIAVANEEVVFDDAAQRRQRQKMCYHGRAVGERDGEGKAIAVDAQMQCVRPAVVANRRETVALEQVKDRYRAFVLDIFVSATDGCFIEGDRGETLLVGDGR